MSLIKKALKDAEAARPKTAPYSGPPMMTVDCPPRAGYSNFALTALIAGTMLLSGVMMWKWFRAGDSEMKVRARSYDSSVTPVSAPQPTAVESKPTPVPAIAAPKEANADLSPVNDAPEKKPAPDTSTNTPPPMKPRLPSYKLQGIIYEPGHSSAVINGKTVIAGEHVDGAVVIKVDKQAVTLVNPVGETNLLELF